MCARFVQWGYRLLQTLDEGLFGNIIPEADFAQDIVKRTFGDLAMNRNSNSVLTNRCGFS